METSADRVGTIAESLDCLTEEDLLALAKITPNTAEAWRKRGKGPAYILLGNRYLYPRGAVADYLQTLVRQRHQVSAKGLL
jgi:hypothetical protein